MTHRRKYLSEPHYSADQVQDILIELGYRDFVSTITIRTYAVIHQLAVNVKDLPRGSVNVRGGCPRLKWLIPKSKLEDLLHGLDIRAVSLNDLEDAAEKLGYRN